MKLSEAMMLPSEIPFDAGQFTSCLLGQALNVVRGTKHALCVEICDEWPWLREMFLAPEFLYRHRRWFTGYDIVSVFAFRLEEGRITREKIADWVSSVEPEEPAEQVEVCEIEETVQT